MNDEKDLIIAEDVSLVLVDELVDAVAKSIPGINVAWNMSKALYGAGLKLRQQKALEWVEMVRDNPSFFTKQVFEDSHFQDAFVYSLERYLTVRSEKKRQYFRNIFLGFASSNQQDEFELEKCISTLDQLYEQDIATLRDVDIKRDDKNYQIYGPTDKNIEHIFNLIHSGLLIQDITARFASEGGYEAPYVRISPFGRKFVDYLVVDDVETS